MKITLDWLKQYCPHTLGTKDLCERITMGVAPLESSEPLPDGDHLLEVEITSNRGDLMGVLGIAQEVSALTGTPLERPDLSYKTAKRKAGEAARVTVEDPDLCPRYVARVVEGVKVGASPDWLVRRLESVGLRSVNNIVDVTNFVCLEYGQPLHAFDLDRLAGSQIIVRRARSGEEMTTLDGKKHALTGDTLMIADGETSVAVAGVMGGLESEVTSSTTRILLESASFDPASVRRTARRLSCSTESSSRFERGVAWDGVDQASRRAMALILEVAGGEALDGEIDVALEGAGKRPEVTLRFDQIPRLLGVQIGGDEAARILESLGCEIVSRKKGSLTVSAPLHRMDISREADLLEEILRIHGYDKVPDNPCLPLFPVEENAVEVYRAKVQDLLVGFGYREVLTLSFGDPEPERNPSAWTEAAPLLVKNPPRPELAGLRRGLLRNLLEVKKLNLDHGNDRIRIFEIGRAYLPQGGDSLPLEKEVLGILADEDPLDLKGVCEAVPRALGYEGPLTWRPGAFPLFRPSWECLAGETRLGVLGLFSAASLEGEDLKERQVAGAELDLDGMMSLPGRDRCFRPLPRLPGARRDISLVLDESVPWGEVERVLSELKEPLLRDVTLFDLYRGKQIPQGKKNFAFTLTYRSDEKTLSGEEVEAARRRAVDALRDLLGGEVRA